jgi:diguanylate cyclase (GGDEF)-like protein
LREENERLTVIDPVTQALKYHTFLRALGRELKRAKMLSVRSAVGLLDLDNFKAYSEIHGLKAGREVLAQVAGIVKAHVREFDLVGRLGLDELIFGVFKIGDREKARGLFESIREAVEAYGRTCREPHPLATIGGLMIEPDEEVEDFTAMIHRLRHGQQTARNQGGNQVYFVDD